MTRQSWRKLISAAVLAVVCTQGAADTLTPPAPEPVLAPATSSARSSDILITVLAVLLVWAAYEQNERAK